MFSYLFSLAHIASVDSVIHPRVQHTLSPPPRAGTYSGWRALRFGVLARDARTSYRTDTASNIWRVVSRRWVDARSRARPQRHKAREYVRSSFIIKVTHLTDHNSSRSQTFSSRARLSMPRPPLRHLSNLPTSGSRALSTPRHPT